MPPSKQNKPTLEKYPYIKHISTRWSDNDRYGHLNNAVYYHFYDALVNGYMIDHCSWHPGNEDGAIGLVVSSGTEYYEIIKGFPEPITLGLAVTKLGKSSVEYEIGVFQNSNTAKAVGRFVHVFVDKHTDKTRPEGMPSEIRNGLSKLVVSSSKL